MREGATKTGVHDKSRAARFFVIFVVQQYYSAILT